MIRTPLRRYTPLRRRNKFNAKPVHDLATGQSFDSTGESRRWASLQLWERSGLITGLTLHPKVILIPARGKAPEIAWRVDYSYIEAGRTIFEDWKPRPMTPRETLLCKLWQHYGPGLLRITGKGGAVLRTVMPANT